MKQFQLKIVTPEKVLYQDMVESVTVPTAEGEITVLPQHLPIISAINPGELKIKKGGEYDYFSVTRGVIEVDGKTVTLLVDAAESANFINEKRAEEAKERAKKLMEGVKQSEEGYADAVAQMERALSRLRIAKKRRGGRATFNQDS
ncbi:MAG: hypothetical protein ACD_51C00224G0013 [uncultured bacterium]|nr:MAG: hypothetical protein ACD_51C00224G0013 [uncultured bacterium]OGJ48638.1 MAG: ATP synthase F1 subunit epsilon [Candidatus Peregrinibacteria bacterium RIFOXYB12_FULL_41_12]OGJ48729.1 MAG: ATP synthase F1 subunit epsilon [Candidatus Peregrinibacteria bacterium RIFOXYA2_FULL_41_18]OGJ52986.1 MAG: ATP synthase F1 subunit epsilon [Candidatus Peregrinibacteria bacterium RIFOXYC2_FULL_41_22]OGJ54841.1 MAG: ATP synthase F1 subunit epsilon [Candidatus Peregrinibacteria bacterium RIFOXYB2_FULL_41_